MTLAYIYIYIYLDYSTRAASRCSPQCVIYFLSQYIGVVLHIGVAFSKWFIIAVKQVFAVHRIALYVASPLYEGLFRWRGRFRLGRVDPLEEGRSTVEGVAQSVYVDTTSCSAVGWPPCEEPGGA
ncbi:hypothetical protein M9H77_07861 [Catharanthus roseus]|uniref:Uncharacterized protein n=1 Tax=Catharanthus roseus TaxID=4058 RepID=A0ACC0BW98_CATRO|nr:hypothetical protein M9H77_07861 [Catharanthus roseus]